MARKARDDARAAAREAAEALSRVRRAPVDADPAPVSAPDLLTLEPGNDIVWLLRNRTDEEIVLAELVNRMAFFRRPFDSLPVAIPPQDTTPLTLVAAWGTTLPEALSLRLGSGRIVLVPIPPEAG
jgi:hypothetical protein